jgi:hypothetical protein
LQLRIDRPSATWRCGSETALVCKEVEMRIVETGMAGFIAIASQILVFAAVLL